MAFVAVEVVAKEHAQWRHSDMKEKSDTQTREDPGASFVIDGAEGRFYLRGSRRNAIAF